MIRHFNIFLISTACVMGILGAMLFVDILPKAKSPDTTSSVINVNTIDDNFHNNGDCSLREAITAANQNIATDACPAGEAVLTDTIHINVSGVIHLFGQIDVLNGGPITIVNDGAGSIEGSSGRIFYVDTGVRLTLEGLTLRNGYLNEGYGGGIYNNGMLTISGSTISANSIVGTGAGGGIYNGNQLTIRDSRITGNYAHYAGGGISNSGAMTVTRTTIAGNGVTFGLGQGSGIYNAGSLTLIKSTISNQTGAIRGAGLFNNGPASATIVNSTISGNTVTQNGGGIYNQGILKISSSTISSNSAGDFGGGIYSDGMYNISLKNTILADNSSGRYGPDCYSFSSSSEGYNLVGNIDDCSFVPTTGDLTNISSRLGPLQDYSGPTYTHILLPGSPAINAGDPDGCTDDLGNLLENDQRGKQRFGRCDIGAFELQAYITVYCPLISKP